jgi:hypothetical protein
MVLLAYVRAMTVAKTTTATKANTVADRIQAKRVKLVKFGKVTLPLRENRVREKK